MSDDYLDEDRKSGRLILLLSACLAAFIAWAGYFEIDQTVHTTGQVILSARTQLVQTADGGVLKELTVQEGDTVTSGQLLAVLEKERVQANLEETRSRTMSLRAALLRAKAEVHFETPQFGTEFKRYPEFVSAQQGLYMQRKRSLDEELRTLQDALAMALQEKRMNDNLFKNGDISELDVLRAKRQVSEIEGRIAGTKNKYLQDTRTELTRIEDELSSQNQKLNGAENLLSHTDIMAPMDGVVKTLKIHTLGGVLRPGDELMQIAPVGDALLLEAKVLPSDIGQLVKGQMVFITLDAYDYSIYGNLKGELIDISPDTLSDSNAQGSLINTPSGQPSVYYKVTIGIAKDQENSKVTSMEIKPGMTASIDIRTGTRNLLTYLLKPVIKTLGTSLNER
ncbi:MAG: HlyD family type I secretion periplasmic adaptor subunit [Betaproteobacteria bacterium]|nr:HlyD family type I secretion periplasmic adaptor subunit [Betaproteobacteria bacterium]